MKYQNNIPFIISKCFLSYFYVGFIKKAPGTFGSIATIPFILVLAYLGVSFETLLSLIIILTIISSICAEYVQRRIKIHDPQWIVMDEVIGMLVTWAFVFPSVNFNVLLPVLGLFRVFDIIKIWPASYFDKKIKHGFGTIVDDIISGLMAGFILWAINNYYLIS